MAESNTGGQVIALLTVVGFLALWLAIDLRRQRVRERMRLRRLAKVSPRRITVREPSTDRSEA